VLTDYTNALQQHLGHRQLLTRDQYGGLPLWSSQNASVAVGEGDLKDRSEALAAARREVLARHIRLSQCYDYFEAAKSSKNFLFELYKMVETIEGEYGGEREAVKALGLTEIKRFKHFANNEGFHARDSSRSGSVQPRRRPPVKGCLPGTVVPGATGFEPSCRDLELSRARRKILRSPSKSLDSNFRPPTETASIYTQYVAHRIARKR